MLTINDQKPIVLFFVCSFVFILFGGVVVVVVVVVVFHHSKNQLISFCSSFKSIFVLIFHSISRLLRSRPKETCYA